MVLYRLRPPSSREPGAKVCVHGMGSRGPAVAILGFVLTSCVHYEPQPLDPDRILLSLEERTREHIPRPGPGLWRAAWFPFAQEIVFEDGLTLEEANSLALHSSFEIRVARADADVAAAQVWQAGVLPNPQVFLGPRASTHDGQRIFPASLTWNVLFPERANAEKALAGARWNERLVTVIQTELAVLERVRMTYLRLWRLGQQERELIMLASAVQEIVGWIESLSRAGEVDAVSLYLTRAEQDDVRIALEKVRSEAMRARGDLFADLGLLPGAQLEIIVDASSAVTPDLPESDREAWLAVPISRLAEAGYESAEARLRLEISEQYPNVQIGPQFEDDRGEPTIGFGVQVELPLFDRNRGGIATAERQRDQARARFAHALLEVAHADARAREELRTSENVLTLHEQGAWRDTKRASEALAVRLRLGGANVVEVLAAQRAIARARIFRLELEEQVAAARVRAAVAGGLALERPASERGKETER